ncbi:UNVERIFIED_CONTAM: hypothetical protein FKN15_057204 [Acipenser sinensis]
MPFFLAVSMTLTPFLTRYQCDEPVLPYMAADLQDLQMVLSRQEKISPRQLLEFRMECLKGLTAMSKKILDKSPPKYSLV